MHTSSPGLMRRFSPLILAFALSGLLLGTWMKVASAQNSDPTITQEFEVPYAFSEEPAAPDPIEINPVVNFEPGHEPAEPLAPYGLKIVKSWIPQTFTVGSNNRYIINVSRATTGTITSTLIVEDQLPDGLTWTPPTAAGKWDCTTSTTTHVSCSYAESVAPTQLAFDPITVIVNVPSSIADETITNTARLFYGGTIAPTDVFTAVTPVRSADLLIRKTQTPSPVPSPDTPITYTIVITNNGPTSASSVYVTETLSIDLKPITIWATTAGTFDPITSRWTLNTLLPGQRETLIIRTTPKPNTSGRQITNIVKTFSTTHDWNTSNNTASTSFIVGGLEIGKKVSTAAEYAGKPFDFTIIITNTSSASIGALVKDIFTTTLDIVDCNIIAVASSNKCYVSNRTLNTFISIPAGQIYQLVVTARGNKDIGEIPRTITNTASVTWGSPSFTLVSNEVELVISPGGFAQAGKSNSFSTLYPGQTFTYSVGITNTGSLAFQPGTIIITDTLINNLEYVSINKNGLTMNEVVQTSNVRSWSFPNKTLGGGEKLIFYITVRTFTGSGGGQAINQVQGSGKDLTNRETQSTLIDSDPINDTSQDFIDILKTVTPQQAAVGETLTFKIVLENTGGQSISGIRVNDYFPDVLDLTSATTSRGTATLNTSTREVEINIASMNPGDKTTIAIITKVNATVKSPKTYRNRAYIKWTGRAEYGSNNIPFRVLTSGTLPGTGAFGLLGIASSTPWIIGAAGFLFLLISFIILLLSLWARVRHPLNAGKYARLGLLMLVLAAILGTVSISLASRDAPSQKLAMLAGEKPPVATSLPVLPTSENPSTEKQVENPTPELPSPNDTELLLSVRPSPDPSLPPADQVLPTPALTSGEVDISHMLPTPTPSNLPNFPVPTPTALVSVGPDGGEPDSSSVSRLNIPAIGVDAVVKYVPFSGSTWLISGLKQEIAWMGDTSWPGLGGNTGFAGHVDLVTGERGPFWDLKDLNFGDQVVVYTEKKIYTYRVSEKKVVDDTDMSVVSATTKPQITLITCTGWSTDLRLYVQRLAVFAELISVKPLTALSN